MRVCVCVWERERERERVYATFINFQLNLSFGSCAIFQKVTTVPVLLVKVSRKFLPLGGSIGQDMFINLYITAQNSTNIG